MEDLAEAYKGEEAFSNQEGLTQIGAEHAWARLRLLHGGGDPGAGQTIGFFDSGIDTQHPLFTGKTVTEIFMRGPYGTQTTDEDGTRASHGTTVASVAAGKASDEYARDEDAPHGVAWGADIAMFVFDSPTSRAPVPDDPPPRLSTDALWAGWMERPTAWSQDGRTIDFLTVGNIILGIIERSSEQELRNAYPMKISAIAQTGSREKTVFVVPAGNQNGKACDVADFADDPTLCVNGKTVARSPELTAGLQARIPSCAAISSRWCRSARPARSRPVPTAAASRPSGALPHRAP